MDFNGNQVNASRLNTQKIFLIFVIDFIGCVIRLASSLTRISNYFNFFARFLSDIHYLANIHLVA